MKNDIKIPYGRQWIDESDIESVVNVLQGDFLTTGPAVAEFESGLCATTGAGHAVVVNSGTAALHAAYFAAGVGPGDEIITTPLTFVATANAARYLGAAVRFVDVSPETGNIDPQLIARAVTKKTKAIVPVDFAGHPADYDAIAPLAQDAGIPVIADACHSLGATYRGRRVGRLADMTALSFHPVKHITSAEGGAILTDEAKYASCARRYRNHGITRDPQEMLDMEGAWSYEMQDLGFNYRLSDLQCALGISQLRRLKGFLERRAKIARRYTESFQGIPGLSLPAVQEGVEPAWHLYVLRVVDPGARKRFFDGLRGLGLGVQVHYIPVHFHPYYERLGYTRGQFPVAEDFYSRAVSLPLYPRMTDGDVDTVVDCVKMVAAQTLS